MASSRTAHGLLFAAGALAFLGAGAGLIAALAPTTPDDGPAALVWDREACAHCRMHVGEPAYAAQLRDADGRVLPFDDPGCLWAWLDAHPGAAVHGVYYHAADGDAWLPADAVAFVRHEPTPMGYGWVAVPAGTAGAVSAETARAASHGDVAAGQQDSDVTP